MRVGSKRPKRRINICLPGEWHDRGRRLAAADRRDFSNWLETLIAREWSKTTPSPAQPK